jgi:hypothetical protein
MLQRFIPLPASINTLSTLYVPIWALSTKGAFPGQGTVMGWSSLLNSMGCSDQCRYSVVARVEVTARLTWQVMLFSSLFDFGTGCINAVMCPLDGTYPPSSSRPWFGLVTIVLVSCGYLAVGAVVIVIAGSRAFPIVPLVTIVLVSLRNPHCFLVDL